MKIVRAWLTNFWMPPLRMIYAPDHHFVEWIVAAATEAGCAIEWTPHDPDVVFSSVFGPPAFPFEAFPKARVRVFFTGENQASRYKEHNAFLKQYDYVFGYIDSSSLQHSNALEIPLWMFVFDFLNTNSMDYQFVAEHSMPCKHHPTKNICLVAASDFFGLRSMMLDTFQSTGIRVDCPGQVGNNMAPIVPKINRLMDKLAFTSGYTLVLCPENSYGVGYVTEKPMEAAWAGAIPVYWGDLSHGLTSRVMNKHRILSFDGASRNDIEKTAAKCKWLLSVAGRHTATKLLEMPIFLPDAMQQILKARTQLLAFLRQAFEHGT